jgi:hypothetical protein
VTGVGPEVFAAGDVLTVEIDITGKTAGNIDSLRIGIG